MRLTEARLKKIIKEEVERRVLERIVDTLIVEELKRQGIVEGDDTFEDYKKEARKAFLKKLAAWGLLATVAGGVGAYGQIKAGEITAQNRAAWDERGADYEEYKLTPEYALEEITAEMSRPSNYSWTFSGDVGTMQSAEQESSGEVGQPENFPLLLDKDYGTVGLLSPEYGVVRQLYDDVSQQLAQRDALKLELQNMIEEVENSDSITMDGKRALIEEYMLEIQILDDMPLNPSVDLAIEGTGDASEWLQEFPGRYNLPVTPNYQAPPEGLIQGAFDAGFSGDVPVSPHYDGMIYLPYDNIPEDMVLPLAQETPSEYYITLWNKHFPDNPIEQESE